MSNSNSGSCHCGAVGYITTGDPKFVSRCHCNSCRKTTGAAFSTWVGFRKEQVEWRGAPSFYASSPGVKRGYCSACGTPLSYESDKWPGERHFLVGVFDEPEKFTPSGDFLREEGLAWVKT